MISRYLINFIVTILVLGSIGCTDSTEQSDETDIFMWMGSNHLIDEDPRMYESMLAFADRHSIIPYESGANTVADLERFLRYTQKEGISKTWIEIGPDNGITIKEFVEDPEKRKSTLNRFRKLARTYKSYYPDFARISIFDEAPLGAFDRDPQNKDYETIFHQFSQYAPKAFSLLYDAFKEEFPEAEVGIFLHHPHNASPEMAGRYSYIESFMKSTDSLGTAPDFIYSDVYRGYFNRGYGQEATDKYITDVVRHTKEVAKEYDIEAYQLGQAHTIKLGYTPSQRQIDTNVEAMLEGNPDGIGWYWPNYAATNVVRDNNDGKGTPANIDVSFNPFVPNNWGKIGPAGSLYGTSRDRFSYSYLRMLEATDQLEPDKAFDLWIYGHDFDHVEHAVLMKPKTSSEEQWEFIGYINPQQDKDGYEEDTREQYMYSYNEKWHAVIFRGLSRQKFLNSDTLDSSKKLEIKIESTDESDGSELTAVYAMPYYQTRHFVTEQKVTELIEQQSRWVSINSLGSYIRPVPFTLNSDTVFTGTVRGEQPYGGAESFRHWLDTQYSSE
ncbi:hypothetical protein [Fodinibius sp. AD559]|uniref:hypothetical protein n=1 Tax=Fodinibius sp. AD559 TaxID=3424179 RepID=UPI004046ADE8